MTSGNGTTGSAGLSLAVFHTDGRLEARYPLNRMNIGSGEADTICVEGVGAAFASVVRTVGEEYKVRVNTGGAALSSEETGARLSELTLAEGVKFRIGGVLISCDRETPFQSGVDELSDICPFCLTQMPDRAATSCHDCGRSLQWLGDSRWSGWTPTTLGDYQIRCLVGSGGMGVVLRGNDGNDRLAAVKVIRSKFPNPSVLRRFDAEVAIIRDMPPHPNIVGYRGHGIEAQRLRWLAMEWVEGVTLAEHLASKPQHKLSIEQIASIMGQLIQGLRHLHKNGIAHRDLKPANIFLRKDQGVKIVDFGIAHAPDAGAGLTTTGHLAGTKNYASPEQNKGGEAGPASDLYSLGLMWQEMLTGANTGGALRIRRDDCPRAWKEIIGDMLELEPSSRPTSERVEADLRTMTDSTPQPKPVVGARVKERVKLMAILAQSASILQKSAGQIIEPTPKSICENGKVIFGLRNLHYWFVKPTNLSFAVTTWLFFQWIFLRGDNGLALVCFGSAAITLASVTIRCIIENQKEGVALSGRNQIFFIIIAIVAVWLPFEGLISYINKVNGPGLVSMLSTTVIQLAFYTILWAKYVILPRWLIIALIWIAIWKVFPANSGHVPKEKISDVVLNPRLATRHAPFENSLGMRFVPAVTYPNGKKVLFSIWETRRRDYKVFALEQNGVNTLWKDAEFKSQPVGHEDDHPVVCVSWDGAVAFCAWLTKRERTDGKIGGDDTYRLPTFAEWSCALGPDHQGDSAISPAEKNASIADVYPWGSAWPPPDRTGNFCGQETKRLFGTMIDGYEDGFTTTAPVGRFKANVYGIYDLSGNVWEWCDDSIDGRSDASSLRVLRGGSWFGYEDLYMRSAFYSSCDRSYQNYDRGFRLVLDRGND